MYICPICAKIFEKESWIQEHFLPCWREAHPWHQSNSAPRIENINREVNEDINNFFKIFKS